MKWFVETKKADFNEVAKKHGISPMVARLLRNREINTDEDIELFLRGRKDAMHNPRRLKDMERAVDILQAFLAEGKKIRIIGDYDIDGICSSFILQQGIKFASPFYSESGSQIDIRIPHRVMDGYGLNDRLIEEAIADGVDLIITCDNGIAADAQIAHAKEAGIAVIVTDHHEVPYEEIDGVRQYKLPPADAIVDPKQQDCQYPFTEICGGMVAYKLIMVLTECALMRLGDKAALYEGQAADMLEECFAFAAFATVGDIMNLVDENHIAVKYGLKSIENCKNIGLQALIDACDLSEKEIGVYHIGFVLGPCFNASGRLDDAYKVIELLNCDSELKAQELAAELRLLNAERQELTAKGTDAAIEAVEQNGYAQDHVLVVYLPDVHESLAGIIAGRLCKKYYRPTFVLTDGEECIKGSGRSIEAYHMFDEMTKVKDCFLKYGGHKLAAGLSIPSGTADEFRKRINAVATLTEDDLEEKIMLDFSLPFEYVSFDFIKEMALLEPYGNGNKKPIFGEKVTMSSVKVQGAHHNVMKCMLRNENGTAYDGIMFCEGDEFLREYNESSKKAKIAYTPQINTYRGVSTLQIAIQHYEWI